MAINRVSFELSSCVLLCLTKNLSTILIIIYITLQMLSVELNLYWTRNAHLNDYQQIDALHDLSVFVGSFVVFALLFLQLAT